MAALKSVRFILRSPIIQFGHEAMVMAASLLAFERLPDPIKNLQRLTYKPKLEGHL